MKKGETQQATEPEVKDANAAEETNSAKEATTAPEPVLKRGFRKVHAPGFVGGYKDVVFDDNGICNRISEATLTALQSDFPGLKVKEID